MDTKRLWSQIVTALEDPDTRFRLKRIRGNLAWCHDDGLIELDYRRVNMLVILHELFHRFDALDTDEDWDSVRDENRDYDEDTADERAEALLGRLTPKQAEWVYLMVGARML